ncbi:MAG: recombinase family protein [Clostridiales bacterium]|jgi:DNA invertase Pin-like site-specific DNA recombinase|nr:recombinase family protein [Clostridiales bacterium]
MSEAVALYMRLSKEAGEDQAESESISNQRRLLLRYCRDNDLAEPAEYIDDGYSGTNFDRPAFKQLILDVESGHINMIITKDMSRLGRDYLLTGHYIEKYFPEKRVRYISLLDNIDTYVDSPGLDIAPFKAILNDMYSKDLGKKIKSALRSKKSEGKFVGVRAPFGYCKSPDDKHQLVIDPGAALIVQEIFEMFLGGTGCVSIAHALNERNVPTPAVHNNVNCGNASLSFGLWNNNIVKRILQNEVCTGKLIQNKYKKLNYKSTKLIYADESEFTVVENCHEAIISQETFAAAARLLEANKGMKPQKHFYLLSGLIKCGDCGSAIILRDKLDRNGKPYGVYGYCALYQKFYKHDLCTSHYFRYDKLEAIILEEIRGYCREITLQPPKEAKEKGGNFIEAEIERLTRRKVLIYEDRLNGIIPPLQYKQMAADIDKRLAELKAAEPKQENKNRSDFAEAARKFLAMEEPSKAVLAQLIDRIEVKKDKSFDIFYLFSL